MPGPGESIEGLDDQDFAEAFDETNMDEREQVGEMRTFEELPDVFDVTRRDGDRDDDEALALDADEFDEDAIDIDSELEEDDEAHARAAPSDDDDFYDDAGNPRISGFDEDALDGATSLEGLDEEVADADLVTGGEDDFTNFQSKRVSDEDLRRMGYLEAAGKDDEEGEEDEQDDLDERLDEALEESFPASDPIAVSRHDDD